MLDRLPQNRCQGNPVEVPGRRKRSIVQARVIPANALNLANWTRCHHNQARLVTMVEIIHEPLKRIVVREIVKYESPQQLVNALAFIMKMGQPILLTWAEGVVFVSQPIPPPEMPEEYVRGELYIASISFAPMSEYSNNVKSGNVEMGVIDVSRSPLSQELARFLRSKL